MLLATLVYRWANEMRKFHGRRLMYSVIDIKHVLCENVNKLNILSPARSYWIVSMWEPWVMYIYRCVNI